MGVGQGVVKCCFALRFLNENVDIATEGLSDCHSRAIMQRLVQKEVTAAIIIYGHI